MEELSPRFSRGEPLRSDWKDFLLGGPPKAEGSRQ